jgi:thiol:disulfide interchange protein
MRDSDYVYGPAMPRTFFIGLTIGKIALMSKISIIVLVFTMSLGFAQKKELTWLSFEELEQALIVQPKKVMIHFYADWCVYCKKNG